MQSFCMQQQVLCISGSTWQSSSRFWSDSTRLSTSWWLLNRLNSSCDTRGEGSAGGKRSRMGPRKRQRETIVIADKKADEATIHQNEDSL
jgi:hypothetical protein